VTLTGEDTDKWIIQFGNCAYGVALSGVRWNYLVKLNMCTPSETASALLGSHPRETFYSYAQEMCIRICIISTVLLEKS
jgi:hypothetical protein